MLNMIDFGAVDDTLEEGRVALDRLEQQLRMRASNHTPDAQSETSSKLQSSVSRKKLDQLPRVARLNNRDESLGLTVEELDDRGLLDGGGSLPSYYSSMKQKNRRTLELQSRSARLQERGKEVVSKILNAIFHMLRIYQRWGVNVEGKFVRADPSATGSIPKKTFLNILKRIELPLRQKELNDVANHYLDPATGKVDYRSLLNNGHISSQNSVNSPTNSGRSPSESGKNVLREVKRMLLEAIKALNKNFDDLYRMFARWDTDGSGTITATQFLRVLNRLHVDISDTDQDFLVELLDTQGMGRIDFESLLTYCLMSANNNSNNNNNMYGDDFSTASSHLRHADMALLDNDDAGAETVSAMSVDGNTSVDLKSLATPLQMKRPSTASHSRLQPPRSPTAGLFDSFDFNSASINNSHMNPSLSQQQGHSNQPQKVRPMTALARVSTNQFTSHASPDRKRGSKIELDELELVNLPDDVIHGEENYLLSDKRNLRNDVSYKPVGSASDQYDIMAPPSNSSNRNRMPASLSSLQVDAPNDGNIAAPEAVTTPSHTDHLVLLANQTLSTLRDIILGRYRRGRSLYEIFQHFDRAGRGYFDLHDLMRATADLRIETSERVARLAIDIMAIDSKDFVTFGEFKVYALDTEHASLVSDVQNQLGQLYERYGKGFEAFLRNEIQKESLASVSTGDEEIGRDTKGGGILARDSIARVLKKAGLQLPTADMARLLDRFDIYGNDECYVDRFLVMVFHSDAWQQATKNLEYQSRAQQEANYVRLLAAQGEPTLAKEVVDMCEYLGIGVFSEENMVWIAVDALRAPLPVNWTVQRDNEGRNYFFNMLTNQSRWEHPLDPHFRNLRDRYRQSGAEYLGGSEVRPWVASESGIQAIRDKRQLVGIAKGFKPVLAVSETNDQWNPRLNVAPATTRDSNPFMANPASSQNQNNNGGNNSSQKLEPNVTILLNSSSARNPSQLTMHNNGSESFGQMGGLEKQRLQSGGALPIPASVGKTPAPITLNPTFSHTGAHANVPVIPNSIAVSSTMRGNSRPISAPMLYRPWQESVKANQKAKVSNFMQERETMVEAIYTAPYSGKKHLDAASNSTRPSKSTSKTDKEDRMQKLQEMFQENIVERLGTLKPFQEL